MSGSRVARWIAAAGLLALLRGCLDVGAFACLDDDQCDVAGGVCIGGYCATYDETCPDDYRYVERAPSSLAGECTALPSGSDSTTGGEATTLSTTASPTSTSDATTTLEPESSSGTTMMVDETTGASTGEACEGDLCACALDVFVGGQHSCAIRLDGSVVCWGQNTYGQINGDPDTEEVAWPQPIELPGGATVERVSAYYRHTCLVAQGDGSVWCWGGNMFGGAAPSMLGADPVAPTSDSDVVDPFGIGLGLDHTCTIDALGSTTCWGRNNTYQLASTITNPGPVTTGPHVEVAPLGLAVGHHHGCLWNAAEVECWGNNDTGQLGLMGPNRTEVPTIVMSLPGDVIAVAAGIDHTCAAVEGGASVWCWGRNDSGQLGNPPSETPSPMPLQVVGNQAGTVTELLARGDTTCARLDDGEIWCWGGDNGQSLGTDAADGVPLHPPARVTVPEQDFAKESIVRFGVGVGHMCAVTNAMRLWCWGAENFHQTGPIAPDLGAEAVEVNLDCPS